MDAQPNGIHARVDVCEKNITKIWEKLDKIDRDGTSFSLRLAERHVSNLQSIGELKMDVKEIKITIYKAAGAVAAIWAFLYFGFQALRFI